MQEISASSRRAPCFAGLILAALAGVALPAQADDTINADRPDFADSSSTVGKGRFQVEMGVAGERRRDAQSSEHNSSTPLLLRYGVSEDLELRLDTDGRSVSRSDDLLSHTRQRSSGYADVSPGLKWHVQDQRGALPAIGVLVHVDIDSGSPALRGKGKRPMLRLATEWDLPGDMSLGLMHGLVADRNDEGRHFGAAMFGAVLDKEWTARWRSFVELAAPRIARARNGGNVLTADVGSVYLLTPNCQVDVALMRGLNKNAPDLAWTVGLSFRL